MNIVCDIQYPDTVFIVLSTLVNKYGYHLCCYEYMRSCCFLGNCGLTSAHNSGKYLLPFGEATEKHGRHNSIFNPSFSIHSSLGVHSSFSPSELSIYLSVCFSSLLWSLKKECEPTIEPLFPATACPRALKRVVLTRTRIWSQGPRRWGSHRRCAGAPPPPWPGQSPPASETWCRLGADRPIARTQITGKVD